MSKYSTFLLAFFLTGAEASASSGITYHGRLMRPDSTPVSATNVQFRLQIRTPGTEDCLLYEEIQTMNLSTTNGTFAISMADGTGSRQDAYSWTLFDVFSNRKAFNSLTDCVGGTSYTPNPTDNRDFRVSFNDGTFAGWEDLPVQNINFIPMSIESYSVGGYPASSLLRVETAGVLGTPSPMTSTQYTELMALIGGTSSQYSSPNELNGSALPAIGSGQSVRWTGAAWEAYTPPTNASLPTCTAGQVLFSNGTALSCVTDGGSSGIDGDDITSGTIGGTTAWNTSGNIQTTGTISATGAITGGSLSGSTVSTRDLRVYESTNTNYVSIQAPAGLTPNYTLTLPVDDGGSGQVLSTNGSGLLSWVDQPSGNVNLANIRSTINPLSHVFPSVACAVDETLRYDGMTDTYQCEPVEVSAAGLPTEAILDGGNTSGATVVVGTNDNQHFQIETNGTAKMTVLSGGNVGVGTTNPATKFHVDGTIKIADGGEACSAGADGGMIRYSGTSLQFCNGSAWQTLGLQGAGVTSLNGITVSTQTFAVGTAGTDPDISSAGSVHTLNIPMASAPGVNAGLISKAQYDTFAGKQDDLGFVPLDPANNLSELADASVSRTNLGLGTAAVLDTGTTNGTVPLIGVGDKLPSSIIPGVDAGSVANTPAGNIAATTVQGAINELDTEKVAKAGDTMTGTLNLPANGLVVGTSQLMVSGGNVGIGTATPGAKLTVVSGDVAIDTDHKILLNGSADNNWSIGRYDGSGAGPFTSSLITQSVLAITVPNTNNNEGFAVGVANGNSIFEINQNGTSYFRGNVGIGTTNPATKFHVDGSIKIADGGETCSAGTDGGMIRYSGTSLQFCNGSAWQTLGLQGAGVTSLNGITVSTQTFAIGTSGNDPAFSSAGSVHTLNIPMAATAGVNAGLISKAQYDTFAGKQDDLGFIPLDPANNLSDVADASTSRTNLGLGTAATLNTGTTNGTIPVIGVGDKLPSSIIPDVDAGTITNTPAGNIAATDVQAAINELDTEKVAKAGDTMTGTLNLPANGLVVGTNQLVASGNRVGIGTSSPSQTLDVRSTASEVAYFSSSQATGGVSVGGSSSTPGDQGVFANAGDLILTTDSIERLRINSAGAFALGSTGSAQIISTPGDVFVMTSGSERFRILDNGKIGIGTDNPSTLLEVSGTIKIADGGETCSAVGNGGMIRYSGTSLQYCNGTDWQTLGLQGAGITSLNGITVSTQTFAVGTSGDAPDFSSAGSVHTLNIPMASSAGTVTAGLISNAEYAALDAKLDAVAGSTLNSAQIWVGNNSNEAAAVSMTGDATLSNAGALEVTHIHGNAVAAGAPTDGQVLRWNNTNTEFEPAHLTVSDIRSAANMAVSVFPTSCTASQTMTWSALTDTFLCTDFGNTASGNIAATTVQGAINELDTEKVAKAGDTMTGLLTIPELRRTPSALPTSPAAGDIAIDSNDTNKLKWYDGSVWQEAGGSGGGGSGDLLNGGNTGAVVVGTNDATTLTLETDNSPRVTVLSTGEVGIGTTSASTLLDVNGAITTRPFGTSTGQAGQVVFYELAAGGSHTFTIRAPDSLTANRVWTLPNSNGSSGQVLATNGAGNLSWTNPNSIDDDMNIDGDLTVEGRVRTENGSASSPSHSFENDTNVGMYRAAADTLGFSTGGTERMIVSNTGVGIGTSDPQRLLQVEGPMRLTASALPLTPGIGDIAIDSGDGNKMKWYDGLSWQSAGSGGAGDILNAGNTTGATVTIGTNDAQSLAFETNNSTKMTILTGGNVGVGTSAPSASLTIAKGGGSGPNAPTTISLANNYLQIGAEEFYSGSYRLIGFGYTAPGASYSSSYIGSQERDFGGGVSSTDLIFGTRALNTDIQPDERMRITAEGGVGIGTTNPNALLTVEGATSLRQLALDPVGAANYGSLYTKTDGKLYYRNGTGAITDLTASGGGGGSGDVLNGGNTVSSTMTLGTNSNHTLGLETNGATKMTILANGNIGIGTTAPSVALDVGSKTDAVSLPRGTTAERPSTPSDGMVRYNSTQSNVEVYGGAPSGWSSVPTIVAKADYGAQSAAIGATNLITPAADGMYEICAYQNIRTAGSSGHLTFRFDFLAESGTTYTNMLVTSITSVGEWNNDCYAFYAKSGSPISYRTSFSGSPGSVVYTLHVRLKRMD